jgi:hypothetical protein
MVQSAFFQFFTTRMNNCHTRKAYLNATRHFAQWCEARGILELAAVEWPHVVAFINELQDKDQHQNTHYEFRLKTGSYTAAASFFTPLAVRSNISVGFAPLLHLLYKFADSESTVHGTRYILQGSIGNRSAVHLSAN